MVEVVVRDDELSVPPLYVELRVKAYLPIYLDITLTTSTICLTAVRICLCIHLSSRNSRDRILEGQH